MHGNHGAVAIDFCQTDNVVHGQAGPVGETWTSSSDTSPAPAPARDTDSGGPGGSPRAGAGELGPQNHRII